MYGNAVMRPKQKCVKGTACSKKGRWKNFCEKAGNLRKPREIKGASVGRQWETWLVVDRGPGAAGDHRLPTKGLHNLRSELYIVHPFRFAWHPPRSPYGLFYSAGLTGTRRNFVGLSGMNGISLTSVKRRSIQPRVPLQAAEGLKQGSRISASR